MKMLHYLTGAMCSFTATAAAAVPHAQRKEPVQDSDAFVQGAEKALQAYTKASDAYAENMLASVALWSVIIAVVLVLLEWLVARRGARPDG
jgi:hypothetical protein